MSTSINNDVSYLGSAFTPTDLDVIVGRGKVCYKHTGNLRLARVVQSVLTTYSASEATKKSKTELIKSIVQQVRENSPDGGFVKFDSEKGEWFEVGDRTAREKVSQAFRDALTDQYKSSSTSKTLKRRQERITRQISYRSDENESQASIGNNNTLDPVNSLPFGSMSLVSPSPHSNGVTLGSHSPHAGYGLTASPGGNYGVGTRSPRGSFVGMASPGSNSLGLGSPSRATGFHQSRNLVSPATSFSQSPGRPLSARFSASPSLMSLAAQQNAGLGPMGESPSSVRLAMAIAERKRRLTNLNMIMTARRNAGQSMGGLGRPQVPQF